MGLNVNLIVHGVPQGHKVWGASDNEKDYTQRFYHSNYGVEEQMIVERIASDGTPYFYYTYVRAKNVHASDGRSGSYIALTLRLNAFYADIQNMYHILSAAYHKEFVGMCVLEQNGGARFLIADFGQVESKLKEAEGKIRDYLFYFSKDDDLPNLQAFTQSAKGSENSICLLDCDAKQACQIIKNYERLVVSPLFSSTKMQQELEKKEQELTTARRDAQQQVGLFENKMLKQKQEFQKTISTLNKEVQERKTEASNYKDKIDRLERILTKTEEALSAYRAYHQNSKPRQADYPTQVANTEKLQKTGSAERQKGSKRLWRLLKVIFAFLLLAGMANLIYSQKEIEKKIAQPLRVEEPSKKEAPVSPQTLNICTSMTMTAGMPYHIPVKQTEGLKWTVSDNSVAEVEDVTTDRVTLNAKKQGCFTLIATQNGKQILSLDFNVE